MKSLATIRQRQSPRARFGLGVLLVMWLNLVLQPCAMAFGGEHEGDCPNCPSTQTQVHEECGSTSSDMAGLAGSCAAGSADCGTLDDFNFDERKTKTGVDDVPGDLPDTLPPSKESAPDVASARQPCLGSIQLEPPGPSRALNKLYGVYLI